MPSWLRGLLLALTMACALLAGAGVAAAETTLDIYDDYAKDGVIDGSYASADLIAALELAADDAQYGEFASAVQDALDASILGVSPDRDGTAPAPGPEGSTLPVPRNPDENGLPPWPFLLLSGLALVLMVTGLGSSLYRRARR
jgi:hypothetical protein